MMNQVSAVNTILPFSYLLKSYQIQQQSLIYDKRWLNLIYLLESECNFANLSLIEKSFNHLFFAFLRFQIRLMENLLHVHPKL